MSRAPKRRSRHNRRKPPGRYGGTRGYTRPPAGPVTITSVDGTVRIEPALPPIEGRPTKRTPRRLRDQ